MIHFKSGFFFGQNYVKSKGKQQKVSMAKDEFIKWDTDLYTDIRIIDEEHKFLIENINLLHSVVNQEGATLDDSDEAIGRILENLVHYTHTHFVVEEEFMRVYKYPYFKHHKDEHDGFIEKITSLNNDFQEHSLNLSNSLVVFLKDWLTNHILNTDRQLASFLIEKGQN